MQWTDLPGRPRYAGCGRVADSLAAARGGRDGQVFGGRPRPGAAAGAKGRRPGRGKDCSPRRAGKRDAMENAPA